MVLIALGLTLYLLVLSGKRFGVGAPVTFFLLYSALTLLTMVLFETGVYAEGIVEGSGFFVRVLPDQFAQTALIYALMNTVVYGVTIVGGFGARTPSPEELTADRAVTNRVLDSALFSRAAGIGLLLVLTLYVWHFLAIDKSLLIINFRYLTIGNPQDMGMSNPVLVLAHYATGPLGMLTGAMMMYYFRRRVSLYGALCFLLTAYFVMLKLAGFSRWCALILAAVFASLVMMRAMEGRRLVSIGTVLSLCLVLAVYVLVLEGRDNSVQGLAGVVLTIATLDIDPLASLGQIAMNISLGAVTTATALAQMNQYYPEPYKILSFSPLPNAIDGFRQYFAYSGFINAATPFNSISEAILFGSLYFIIYIAVIAWCIRSLTHSFLELGPVIGLILSTPALFAIMAMHTYPMRNSLRLLLYATAMTAWAASRLRRRIRELRAAPGTASPA